LLQALREVTFGWRGQKTHASDGGMGDSYDEILYREVLDRLKAVERENARLKEYVEGLKTVVGKLQQEFFAERNDTTDHIISLNASVEKLYRYEGENQRLHAELDEWVIPLVEKIFPEWRILDMLEKRAQHAKDKKHKPPEEPSS
jgi:hypothetical protein